MKLLILGVLLMALLAFSGGACIADSDGSWRWRQEAREQAERRATAEAERRTQAEARAAAETQARAQAEARIRELEAAMKRLTQNP